MNNIGLCQMLPNSIFCPVHRSAQYRHVNQCPAVVPDGAGVDEQNDECKIRPDQGRGGTGGVTGYSKAWNAWK